MSSILGPDGEALAPLFGAIGNQFNKYMDFRDEHNKRVNAAASKVNKGNKSNNKPRSRGMPDLRGSVTPGSMEPAATNLGEGIQMQKAERHRAGAGYPDGVTRPDYYPVESNGGSGGSGGSVTTTNKNGVTQTLKPMSSSSAPIDMSRTFNDLLAGVGQQPFGGTQIPTTMGNPYTATYKQTAGFGEEIPDIGGYNGATYDSEGGRNAVSSRDLSEFEDFTGNEARIAGGSERISQQATGISSSRLSDALNAVQSEVEMTPERRQLMARAAFLDAPDSMSGLRAKEAVNNVVYAGGQHYVPGESADSPAVAINRSDARNIANNKAKAEDFKAKKVAETVAAVKQSPTVLEEVAQTQAFKQDKPQYSQSTPAIGGQIEFENTNPKNTPAFGKTGGYSSGFTRIDTSMTNPFS